MVMSVIKMLLPIVVVLLLGFFSKRWSWITDDGIQVLKTLVSKICLPMVLFNAFLTTTYSKSRLLVTGLVLASLIVLFVVGFLIKGLLKGHEKYMPFLITGTESGMIGFPLAAMILGVEGTRLYAMVDMAVTIFFFVITVSAIKIVDGEKISGKMLAKTVMTSFPLLAMVIGIILNFCGVYSLICSDDQVLEIYDTLIDFLAGPTTFLILLTVGYDLSFKKNIMKPVIITEVIRLVLMSVMCALVVFIVMSVSGFDKNILIILILGFILPAPFALPIFSQLKGQQDYVSTTISFSTVVSLLMFAALVVVSNIAM